MRYSLNIAVVVLAIIVYSCNSTSKKHAANSIPTPPIIHSKNPKNAEEQTGPMEVRLIFPKFTIKLHNFCVSDERPNNTPYYLGDTSNVSIQLDKDKIWNFTAKTDTINLQQYNADTKNNIIEVIPEDKTDSFTVSYYSKIYIEGFNKKIQTEVAHPYNQLKDSAAYFFKIPGSIYDRNSGIDEIKNKLKLKDTLIKYKASDGKMHTTTVISYKNKACEILSPEPVYFKIERFNNNKLVDTKNFTVELINAEDND